MQDHTERWIDVFLSRKTYERNSLEKVIKSFSDLIQDTLGDLWFFSIYHSKEKKLVPICSNILSVEIKDLTFFIDLFDNSNPYTGALLSPNPIVLPINAVNRILEPIVATISDDKRIKHIVIIPIELESKIIATFTIFSKFENLEYSKVLKVAKNLNTILSEMLLIIRNQMEYKELLQYAKFVQDIAELTIETTKIPVLLENIIPQLIELIGSNKIAVFIREIGKYTPIYNMGVDEKIIQKLSNPPSDLASLAFFNNPAPLKKYFDIDSDEYITLFPTGTTDFFIGFIVIISKAEILSQKKLQLIRLVSLQLFLSLQRIRLLDDMQRVVETGEFAFYPIVLIDKNYKILYANNKAEDLAGLSSSELLGNKFQNVFPIKQEDLNQLLGLINRVIATITRTSIRIGMAVTHAGISEEKIFFVQLEPTINNLTGEYCVVLTFLDITEAIKFETIKEEYTRRSRMYLNILTHDIYNIFFAIRGYFEILSPQLKMEDNTILERINSLISRGTKIVQNIRLLSKILDVTTPIESTKIPIKTLVQEVMSKMAEELKEEGEEIHYTINIDPSSKPLGGPLLTSFFTILFRIITMLARKKELEILIEGEEKPTEKKFLLKINCKGVEENVLEKLRYATTDLSKTETSIKENVEVTILSEILRKYNYSMHIRGEKDEKGMNNTIISIFMPTSEMESNKES